MALLSAGTANAQPAAEATGSDSWQEALAAKVIAGMHGRTISIGRGQGCMVRIGRKATTISRIHAEITESGSGRYAIRVLGTNGVRVNGVLHTKGTIGDLQTDDEINFVGIRYRFRAPQAQAQQPVPEASAASVGASSEVCAKVCAEASAEVCADDWWPEPARKRTADSENASEQPVHKRARELSSEYGNSTDTLVNSSDAGHVDSGKSALLAKQVIDDLPPSSPIYMSELADVV
ncbi:hypothetical protein LPJ59_006114, partial [Coemansia sp. RSA 2399]